jgi:hypothetical protein
MFAVIAVTLYTAAFWEQDPLQLPTMISGEDGRQLEMPETTGILQSDSDEGLEALSERSNTETLKLKLKVIAMEPTLLKVIIDGQVPKIYQLKAKDRLDLEAGKYFNLLMDNASGIELFFNETPIRLSGKPGQNVNIQLP